MESIAYKLISDLWDKNRNFCSSDYDKCLEYINRFIPLKIYTYHDQDPFLGWQIPPKWDLIRGQITCNGQVIFHATQPLHVIGLSTSFSGTISREELKKHLHFDARRKDAVPYHFRQNYRPWERDWGFCVTQEFYDSLESGHYTVEIETQESAGYLSVAEHTHQGIHPETFVFVAHLDHGGMANDDLAGVAVGVEAFHRLLPHKTKFSYRVVFVQEIIGSVYYLGQNLEVSENVLESCFLEMLGSNTPLALQKSYKGVGQIERELASLLSDKKDSRVEPFRSIICNDEMVWESFNFPMASLSRFPYPEYHSDFDNPSIISEVALNESIQIILDLIERLDKSTFMRKKFQGVPALSSPLYNLYVDPGQRAFGNAASEEVKNLRLLMDMIPIFPKHIFIEQIADLVQMPPADVLNYLKKWENKGLVELI